MGLSFTIAAGPRQRTHSRVLVPWDSRSYFTVSDLRLPFLSPPTTRRAAVELFDPPPHGKLSNRSQSHIATDGQSVSKSWCDQIFITIWQLRSCFPGVPSLTRGRVCLLYMLLSLASVVFLRSESLGTQKCPPFITSRGIIWKSSSVILCLSVAAETCSNGPVFPQAHPLPRIHA
jgi:hypothetical protein